MNTLSAKVAHAADRMKAAEAQRLAAGEMPGHSLCSCGHVLKDEYMAYHLSVSPLHR